MTSVVFHDLPPEETYRQIVAALLSLQCTSQHVFGRIHADMQEKRGQVPTLHITACTPSQGKIYITMLTCSVMQSGWLLSCSAWRPSRRSSPACAAGSGRSPRCPAPRIPPRTSCTAGSRCSLPATLDRPVTVRCLLSGSAAVRLCGNTWGPVRRNLAVVCPRPTRQVALSRSAACCLHSLACLSARAATVER